MSGTVTEPNGQPPELPREDVLLAELRPHPRNYQEHPDDQIEHLMASIRQFGFFRNVVVTREGTILAGHGAIEAASRLGMESVPAVRLELDPDSPDALKVLALDNEVPRFAERDDRGLSEILREIAAGASDGLAGTGYDEMILADLVMVTRPASEIQDFNEAAEWVGMPEYTPEDHTWKLVVQFTSEEDRAAFIKQFGIADAVAFSKVFRHVMSAWWPKPDAVRHDGGLRWEQAADPAAVGEPVEEP